MLKNVIQSIAKITGHQIVSLERAQCDSYCLQSVLNDRGINLVIDVGANLGQFAQEMRYMGYEGQIISFEPLATTHKELTRIAAHDPNWSVAPRMALGASSGEVRIHVAGNTVSSSIYPMLDAHQRVAPESAYVNEESVPLNKLDDVCPMNTDQRALLKIDVQGYEKAVLDGASQILERCQAVVIEMSLVPLYEGQMLALGLWSALERLGFQACNFRPGFRDPSSRRMLQMDGVFVRR